MYKIVYTKYIMYFKFERRIQMFVEEKKIVKIGGSTGITIKTKAGPMLRYGDEVTIEYSKDKIVIKKVAK